MKKIDDQRWQDKCGCIINEAGENGAFIEKLCAYHKLKQVDAKRELERIVEKAITFEYERKDWFGKERICLLPTKEIREHLAQAILDAGFIKNET